MKIAVAGIGGVGGYYGGLLSQCYRDEADIDIVFIARGKHLDEIRKNGLLVQTEQGDFRTMPNVVTDTPSGVGHFDIVLFCVKGYDLEKSAEQLLPCIGQHTVVIPLLNGVNNAETVKSFLTTGIILNGCVYIGAHIVQPGVCRQTGGACRLFFGHETDVFFSGSAIEKLFKKAQIKAQYRKHITTVIWEKYLFVSPFASATTYLNKSMRELFDCKKDSELLETLLTEILALAKLKGVELSGNIFESTIGKVQAFPYETKTSMQMDFERGGKTELDTFTGFVVNEAGKLGLSVPYHQKIYYALKQRL